MSAGVYETERPSFHTDQTTVAAVVVLGYPGREISIHGPFDLIADAKRYATWITDTSKVPATVLYVTSVTPGAVMLAKFHAEKETP